MKKILFIFLFATAICFQGLAQPMEAGLPYSIQFQMEPVINFFDLPDYDYSKMIVEDKARIVRGEKRYRFAKKFIADLSPFNNGLWQETPNGGRVWRIGIRSVKAYSLYIILSEFTIQPGVRIYAYNSDLTDWHGPFTNSNNNKNNLCIVPPVKGNDLILELNVDAGITDFGNFTIEEIWHDYRNINETSKIKSTVYESGSCNVDINCPTGAPWEIEKRAICRFIANGEYCTGTLINNVPGEKIPYVLSAYHCIENAEIASKSIYYFDYEKPYCNAPTINTPRIISGAELKATTPNQLDFTLVRLNRFPPMSYGVYLAGWDAGFDPPTSGTCIHHPSGDAKKISITVNPLTTGNFGEGFNLNSHWLVSTWDIGTTEGGSSGAPFFNKLHRIIGTLSGGDANCENSVNDYFTKFALEWNFYTDSTKQLKYWLDPQNTGLKTISGTAPYGLYTTNCDTVSNIANSEPVLVSTVNYTWGTLSGQNSEGDKAFAEKFTPTGSIPLSGIFITPAMVSGGNAFSYITIKIWSGNDFPQQEIYSQVYFLKYIEKNVQNYIALDSIIHLNGTFFIGYTVNYQVPEDVFAVYHAQNRNNGQSTMFINRNDTWINTKDIPSNPYSTSLAIRFTSCEPLEKSMPDEMMMGPNPSSDFIVLTMPVIGEVTSFECFDVIGKKQYLTWEVNENKIVLNVGSLKTGIYTIRFTYVGNQYVKKIAVIQSN